MTKTPRNLLTAAALLAAVTTPALLAQPYYSIDFQGPTATLVSSADILIPAGGPPPAVLISEAALGIVPGSAPRPEVDALSWGNDPMLRDDSWHPRFFFSVDEFAVGIPGSPLAPNVRSEGATGNREASADVYFNHQPLPLAPIAPGPVFGNTGIWDGNGFLPFPAPGLSLREPNPFNLHVLPDRGDNLDALIRPTPPPSSAPVIYFSLDAKWTDPLELPPANSGTAAANGFAPGDILFSQGNGLPPTVYAGYTKLGLGPDDDVDALVLWDNGNGTYEPSVKPFDWMSGQTDMLLFSVRRGSPLIGTPDAFFGEKIEEGDILTPSPLGPGIFIAAETLGLATVRSGFPTPFGHGDDLDALSL